MKLVIIFGILAVAYLVYRSLAADPNPTENQVEKPAVEEVSMPNAEFKSAIQIAGGIAGLIVLLILAAFLL